VDEDRCPAFGPGFQKFEHLRGDRSRRTMKPSSGEPRIPTTMVPADIGFLTFETTNLGQPQKSVSLLTCCGMSFGICGSPVLPRGLVVAGGVAYCVCPSGPALQQKSWPLSNPAWRSQPYRGGQGIPQLAGAQKVRKKLGGPRKVSDYQIMRKNTFMNPVKDWHPPRKPVRS